MERGIGMFKGKKKQEEQDLEEEQFLERFRGEDIPILILDERWLRIFPDNYKTPQIKKLEKELRQAFMYQAKLTSEIEDAEKTKKQLMERIIQFMNVAQVSDKEAKKQEKSQEFIKDINLQLSDLEAEYEEMPDTIKNLNEELLIESLRICYRRMKRNKEQMQEQRRLIAEAKALLEERTKEKEMIKKETEHIFTFMHRIYGARIIELFDEFDEMEEDE